MALQHAIEGPIKDKSVLIILERSSDPDRPVMECFVILKHHLVMCFEKGGKMRFNKKAMELMFYDVLCYVL